MRNRTGSVRVNRRVAAVSQPEPTIVLFLSAERCRETAGTGLRSDEGPHLQILNGEVVMEAERTVAEGVARVTGAVIQVSIQPQAKRTPEHTNNRQNSDLVACIWQMLLCITFKLYLIMHSLGNYSELQDISSEFCFSPPEMSSFCPVFWF